jgi:hypothetical protein
LRAVAKISIGLRPHQFRAVRAYADRGGMDVNDAVRELVDIGLSTSPKEAIILAARQRAFDETRRWAMTQVAEKLNKIGRDAEQSLGLHIFAKKE